MSAVAINLTDVVYVLLQCLNGVSQILFNLITIEAEIASAFEICVVLSVNLSKAKLLLVLITEEFTTCDVAVAPKQWFKTVMWSFSVILHSSF